MPKQVIVVMLFLQLFLSCTTEQPKEEGTAINFEQIQVEGGLVAGVQTEDGAVQIFKGIPYAAPPINDFRWKAPAPVHSWEGVKKCTDFAPSAMQVDPQPFYMWQAEFLIPESPIDEDCLYLNIWTGAKHVEEKRPVVVWIHGGGFVSGSGSVPIYDGEAMAREGVVFVNINYRLGIFGFLAHPELTQESAENASGNYGLMDQIAALQWVKNNIAVFGGDPENITIAGQSAGAASVVFLVASPLAKGLFQKAIAQSGAGLLSRSSEQKSRALMQLEQVEGAGLQVTRELGVDSINQLRKVPAQELISNVRVRAQPIVDGYVLPENALAIYQENKENPISLLTGWNEDDGIVIGGFATAEEYKKRMLTEWGKAGEELLTFYPATNDSIAAVSQKKLQRDLTFGVQNYTLANLVSSQGKEVYVYRFTRKIPAGQFEDFGAFHTGEVPYAYDNLAFFNRPFEESDHQLANAMSSYWLNFIKSGNPNGDGLPDWPGYDAQSREIMVLGSQVEKGVITDTMSLDFLQKNLMVE